jgi:hypothetical protein
VTSRTFQIAASFAIVLVAYWTYALLALPLIETQASVAKGPDRAATADTQSIDQPPVNDWAILFPENAWERHEAKDICSNDQVHLLWKTYANHADGWVELNPLTIIFMTDDTALDPKERFRHAMVMEVPGGANLRFDRPLDLNRGGIGRLIEGRLRGEVNIRSQGKRPDHQDDLRILTHDVELTEQRITTPNLVEFWYGPNWARGRQMEIKLLPRLGPHVANQEGPNIGGVEQIQLLQLERLHLEMGPKPASPEATLVAPPRPNGPLMPGGFSPKSGPVEITCRGPFRFNLVDQLATFRDQVNVLGTHPDAPSDRLTCDVLSVFFTRPPHTAAAPAKGRPNAPGFDLQPARFEAQGSPAVLTVPIEHLEARAERLQYNLIDGQVFLEDKRETTIQKDRNEIHTPSLRYVPGPPGHKNMFQLLAGGPGWLRGEMADRPGQELEARWQTRLEVRPHAQYQVISLTGGAAIRFQAMGQLDAGEIHFRLREVPAAGPPGKEPELQPDQLFALGNVVGNSTQFSCKAEERLDVWFATPPSPINVDAAVPAYPFAARATPPANSPDVGNAYNPAQPLAASPAPYVPSTAAPQIAAYGPQGPVPGAPHSHMEVSGRLLQAHVVLRDRQQGDLSEVTVIDRVHLQETQTAQPGELPVVVTGDRLDATDANLPQAKVIVVGKPAHMEGRGTSLTGPSIAIDRGANRLTMEGAGTMERAVDRDMDNRPLSRPSTLRVDWRKGMTFDGRTAHFQDAVKVCGETQVLETGSMDVGLEHRISFSENEQQQQAQVETIHCGGGVYVVNQSVDDAGRQTSNDHIHFKDLDLNYITGEFHATGPGHVTSVRRGGAQGFNIPGGPLPGPGAPTRPAAFAPGQPATAPLECLDLTFMTSITGNKNRKDMVFHGQVRAAHADAKSWNTTLEDPDPNHLGPQAFVLKSESLEVADMTPVGGSGSSMEFQARDNVIAEGAIPTATEGKPTNFYARCARLSYSQAKDQLIFEGDGRSDAELYKQDGAGKNVEPFKAQKILYFQKTGEAIVNGFHSLDVNPPPARPAPQSASR